MRLLVTATAAMLVIASAAHGEEVTITLSEDTVASIAGGVASAGSPEEAARLFARLASRAIGQAVADTLTQTLGAASAQAQSASIVGWEKFIAENGVALNFTWPTPGLGAAGNLPITTVQGRAAQGAAAPAGITWGASVTIGGSF
jgi:antitoxin (DNA-binding transcriptional repressor) of toxin-antitoxin stability system